MIINVQYKRLCTKIMYLQTLKSKIKVKKSKSVKETPVWQLLTLLHMTLLQVCVHCCECALGWVKCRGQIPSMGHHTWPHTTSLSLSLFLYIHLDRSQHPYRKCTIRRAYKKKVRLAWPCISKRGWLDRSAWTDRDVWLWNHLRIPISHWVR